MKKSTEETQKLMMHAFATAVSDALGRKLTYHIIDTAGTANLSVSRDTHELTLEAHMSYRAAACLGDLALMGSGHVEWCDDMTDALQDMIIEKALDKLPRFEYEVPEQTEVWFEVTLEDFESEPFVIGLVLKKSHLLTLSAEEYDEYKKSKEKEDSNDGELTEKEIDALLGDENPPINASSNPISDEEMDLLTRSLLGDTHDKHAKEPKVAFGKSKDELDEILKGYNQMKRDAGLTDEEPSGKLPSATIEKKNIADAKVRVKAVIGSGYVTIGSAMQAMPGTTIVLDKEANAPIDIYAGGKLIARGDAVVIGDSRNGVRITEFVG